MTKTSILLVDDETAILDICERILVNKLYHVLTATSAEKALEILDKESVHILITDISMPGMGGKKLLEESKKRYPDMSAAIITGYGDANLIRESMSLGAQAFIVKPFSPSELKEMVNSLANKKNSLREKVQFKTLMPVLE